ncbi:MAG: DUF1080 domain-containing protein [Acidobacteriia bacterium]|nr:DUF1080 domain-containing protein [Terriglobia bacterium]
MKRLISVAALSLFVVLAGFLLASTTFSQAKGKWTTLFNGSSLDGWNMIGDANWRLENKLAVADKGTGFLVSKDSYGDFEVRAEFWVDSKANSGVFLRCSDTQKVTAVNAYEVNIFDERPDPTYATGAIVDVGKPATVLKAGGKWNTYDIVAKGSHFTVTLNGTRTVDAMDSKHDRGPIALQYAAGIVKFRKVQIKPL